ncbi:hypothetical protein ACIO53_03940 [Streptomyces sp. NPDC087305]|uniref:hypothetical protein n=1 Tax=Streptomyces sp. NPDC087305 TaxID=3365781 RepID=UPI00382F646C
MPGTRIRRVEATEKSLTVLLFEDTQADTTMTIRHRDRETAAALGTEIEAIMSDAGPLLNMPPLQRHSVRPCPLRTPAGLRDGSPWRRRALWYVVLGLPSAVWLPPDPFLGVFAWLLLPAGVALLRLWVIMAELDTRWVLWRRGITVHATYEADPDSEGTHDCVIRFRTSPARRSRRARHREGGVTRSATTPRTPRASSRRPVWPGWERPWPHSP